MLIYLLIPLLLVLKSVAVQARSIEDYELFHITLLAVPGPLSTGESHDSLDNTAGDQHNDLLPKSMKMQYILGEAIKQNYKQLFTSPNGELFKPSNLSLYNSGTPGTNRSSDALAASLMSNTDYGLLEKITEYEATSDKTCFPPFFGLMNTYQTPISPKQVHQQIHSFNCSYQDVGSVGFLVGKCPGFTEWMQKKVEEHQESLLDKVKTDQLEQELKIAGYELPDSKGSPANTLHNLRSLYDQLSAQTNHRGMLPTNITRGLMDRLKNVADVAFSLQVPPAGGRGDRSKTSTHELTLELLRGFEEVLSSRTAFRGIEYLTSMHRSSEVRAMYLSPLALHSLTTNLGLSSTECLLQLGSKKGEESKCLDPPGYASNWVFELYRVKDRPEAVFVRSRYNGQLVDICGLDTGISKDLFCPYQLFRDIFKNTLLVSRDWKDAPNILHQWGFCPKGHN